MSEAFGGGSGGSVPKPRRSVLKETVMRPLPWWFTPGDEPAERRPLLHRDERGDREAVATLKARYRLLYWDRNDRTILI